MPSALVTVVVPTLAADTLIKAVIQGRIFEERLLPPQRAFPVLVDVLIFIDRRLVAQQNENIGVAAIRDGGAAVCAKLLAERGEPALCLLKRVIWAVELVGAEGPMDGPALRHNRRR